MIKKIIILQILALSLTPNNRRLAQLGKAGS